LASIDAIQKEERTHQKIKIQQALSKMDQAKKVLAQLDLKAPSDGIVVYEISPWRGKKPQGKYTIVFTQDAGPRYLPIRLGVLF
jgi:hypothetical protein